MRFRIAIVFKNEMLMEFLKVFLVILDNFDAYLIIIYTLGRIGVKEKRRYRGG